MLLSEPLSNLIDFSSQMNVIVMSDYGFTDVDYLEPVLLDEYLEFELIQYVILSAGYAQIIPYALEQHKVYTMLLKSVVQNDI